MDCTINGVWAPFLLDTGAAVTLLRKDTWDHVNLDNWQSLWSYSAVQLVGVDGSPLTIHGSATVDLHLDGHSITTDAVVVSPLTAEAILGLDFLHEHQAHIDLPNHQVYLAQRGIFLPLQAPLQPSTVTSRIAVRAIEKLEIQPRCEVEIMASVDQLGVQGTWLLEESTRMHPPASVARTLVQVVSNQVPVRLLNTRSEPVTIYAGTEDATLEQVEVPMESVQTISSDSRMTIDEQKLELLSNLAEEAGTNLCPEEREKFLNLLCSHADVFASSTLDLGKTS